MKYIAIFDDSMLSNFRLDDGGLTLVMTDKNGFNRAVSLKPVIRPTLTLDDGVSLYLTQGHIDAMIEYEKKEATKSFIEEFNKKFTDNHLL